MLPQNRRTAQMFIALWHSLETFIFVFCNLSKSPNDKKNTFVQWYPLVCKRIFPIVTNINSYQIFREVLYFSCSVHLCTFQLVFRTFFCIFFTISIYFTGFWLLLYFLAGIPGLPRLVWELTFSESDTTRILNILSANFVPPFQFHLLLFLFLTFTFYFSQSRHYSILWRHYYPYTWKLFRERKKLSQLYNSWDHRVELCLIGPKRK